LARSTLVSVYNLLAGPGTHYNDYLPVRTAIRYASKKYWR